MSHKDILNKSPYEILKTLNMSEPPFDPFKISNSFNIKVSTEMDFKKIDSIDGEISLNKKGEPICWVNPLKAKHYQRFMLAYQLGYLTNGILPTVNNSIMDTAPFFKLNTFVVDDKKCAYSFAKRLLMPLKSIDKNIEMLRKKSSALNVKNAVMTMSSIFDVSKKIAFYRLQDVGLIREYVKCPFWATE